MARRDSLEGVGHIPSAYSKAKKNAAKTTKERHGSDFYKRIGRMGGRTRGRGYFGYLKDTNPALLKEISKRASEKGRRVSGELREFKRAIAQSLAEDQNRGQG